MNSLGEKTIDERCFVWNDLVSYHLEPKTAMDEGEQMSFSSSDGENGSALVTKEFFSSVFGAIQVHLKKLQEKIELIQLLNPSES